MTATDERRLVAEPIMAWKRATLSATDQGPRFRPVSASGTYGLTETAECRPVTFVTPDDLPPHDAPEVECMCGFYATKERHAPSPGSVTLRVELSGTVIVHRDGYRAQRQRVVAVEVPRTCYGTSCDRDAVGLHQHRGAWLPVCGGFEDDALGLSDLAGRLGVDVSWCEPAEDEIAMAARHITMAMQASAVSFQQAMNRAMLTMQQAAQAMPYFQRNIYTTWLTPDRSDDAVDTDDGEDDAPVGPLEAKRRRDEERRQRLEQLAGPRRAPRHL